MTKAATIALVAAAMWAATLSERFTDSVVVNSIGMRMIQIEAGSFRMGALNPTPIGLEGPSLLPHGDYDELPVRTVTLNQRFRMSVTEVTTEQYRLFRSDYKRQGEFVTGISWHDAVAFTEWLSNREGTTYRLPTEAEWEYAARAGSKALFHSGDSPPNPRTPNAWGLQGVHTLPAEWCLDWHALYPYEDEVDPLGPDAGVAKVVRGDAIFEVGHHLRADGGVWPDAPYYARSANRAGIAPSYSPVHDKGRIGFRVVQAPLHNTRHRPYETPFIRQAIKQNSGVINKGPDPAVPYLAVRPILPIPPENSQGLGDIEAVGIDPGIQAHNHAPALVVCPNGDLLAVYYSSASHTTEAWPNILFVGTRLRFGSNHWDMPEVFSDFPDINEYHTLFWKEKGTIHEFIGAIGLERMPFAWRSSVDNGATWSEYKFPHLVGNVGAFDARPISSAFRDRQGTIYMATDGHESSSVLWASRDNGATWYDTGGRTHGRHTVFVTLKDGSILGMGGKQSDIDGYMASSISHDGGKTWKKGKTSFAALGGNQRPSLIRLKSGRLFFASDFQRSYSGIQPEGISERGAFVALSDDEGITWHVKALADALPHEGAVVPRPPFRQRPDWRHHPSQSKTLGYSVAAQASNGVIHLLTSMNHPNLHFEMNEAWILSKDVRGALAPTGGEAQSYEERYTSGRIRAKWSAKTVPDGRYLLDGTETHYYENGNKQWEVTYHHGQKIGIETHWSPDGKNKWEWLHKEGGEDIWTRWWSNGQKRSESTWINFRGQGIATRWDPHGNVISRKLYAEGTAIRNLVPYQ